MPRADDLPEPEIGHLETPSPIMPGGVKGMGEGVRSARRRRSPTRSRTPCVTWVCESRRLPIRPESLLRRAPRASTRRHEDLEKWENEDIEIARAVKLQPIQAIGEMLGLNGNDLEPYGTATRRRSAGT